MSETSPSLAPLLAADEPPAYSVVNPQASSPIVLTCDHASFRVPRSLGNLGVDEASLRKHVGWDIGAAAVALELASTLDATLILTSYSRLVIDINRALGRADSIAARSEHIDVPANQAVSSAEAERRARACFWPYHDTLSGLVEAVVARGEWPILLAIHSFTPVFDGEARPWEIGILWDTDEPFAKALISHLRAKGFNAGDNQPYDARDGVGYTTTMHAGRYGYRNALIEIRQDLIDTDAGASMWSTLVAEALDTVLSDPAMPRQIHD